MFCESGLYEFVVFTKPTQHSPVRTLHNDNRPSTDCQPSVLHLLIIGKSMKHKNNYGSWLNQVANDAAH